MGSIAMGMMMQLAELPGRHQIRAETSTGKILKNGTATTTPALAA